MRLAPRTTGAAGAALADDVVADADAATRDGSLADLARTTAGVVGSRELLLAPAAA